MKIVQHGKKRKAISPVLATVILIAITLIAAIAVAGFVFGLFGTFTGGQNLQLSTQTCDSTTQTCVLALTNTGGASGSVTGCSIYGSSAYDGAVVTSLPTAQAAVSTVAIPAGTTSAQPIYVDCTVNAGAAIVSGAATTGSLVVASGSPLSFSAIAA